MKATEILREVNKIPVYLSTLHKSINDLEDNLKENNEENVINIITNMPYKLSDNNSYKPTLEELTSNLLTRINFEGIYFDLVPKTNVTLDDEDSIKRNITNDSKKLTSVYIAFNKSRFRIINNINEESPYEEMISDYFINIFEKFEENDYIKVFIIDEGFTDMGKYIKTIRDKFKSKLNFVNITFYRINNNSVIEVLDALTTIVKHSYDYYSKEFNDVLLYCNIVYASPTVSKLLKSVVDIESKYLGGTIY